MPKDMVRLLHGLFLPAARAGGEPCWRPSTDVYRTEWGWLVKSDLAGVRPEEVSVTVEGGTLTLRGCRRDWSTREGHRHHIMEISYSQFERQIELPCDLASARISTESRDGMLLVRIQVETAK